MSTWPNGSVVWVGGVKKAQVAVGPSPVEKPPRAEQAQLSDILPNTAGGRASWWEMLSEDTPARHILSLRSPDF